MQEFLNKMASFSHKWMNAEEYRNKGWIAEAVRGGRTSGAGSRIPSPG
ncbi:hypothetical protein PT974_10518 [Cladobotryum mycophilum]|uniref:Uncharacterized protein n=1 Tax=Cladobotryum mycophilum TaxID=491253 RepID=A0ABR0SA25_9HYPO